MILPENVPLSPRSLNFVKALEFTIPWETGREKDGSLRKDGGLNYADSKLPTKYGIWKGANPDIDVESLDLSKAIEVYKDRYWLVYLHQGTTYASLDDMEIGAAVSLFDAGVNTGVGRAWSWFLKGKNEKDPAKSINDSRGAFYATTSKPQYYNGWMARLNDLKKYVDILRAE